MINISVSYEDAGFPMLELIAKENTKWQASALKSTAWKVSSEIKKGIKSGAPGGREYSPLSLYGQKRRALEIVSGGTVKSRYTIMGRLRQAVGYEGKAALTGVVPVGWLSGSSAKLGERLQEGFETPVTPAVRRMYAAAGLKIGKRKEFLRTPARPTMDPMKNELARVAKTWFQAKILSYFMGNNLRGVAKSKRIYEVYK